MITQVKLLRMLVAGALLVPLSGCLAPIYDRVSLPTVASKTAVVRVKHLGVENERCQASMKTRGANESDGQACNSIGEANGVACGRTDDIVSWQGQGSVTVSSISFDFGSVTSGAVCVDPSTLIGRTPTCKLKEPTAAPAGAALAYKYKVIYTTRDRNCEVDPYIIVNRR